MSSTQERNQREAFYNWVAAFFHSLVEGATRGRRKHEIQNHEEWTVRKLELNFEYTCEAERVEDQGYGIPHGDDGPASYREDDATPYSEDGGDASFSSEDGGDASFSSEDGGDASSEDDGCFNSEDDGCLNGENDGCFNGEDNGCFNGEDNGCFNGKDDGCFNGKDDGCFNGKDDGRFNAEDDGRFNAEDDDCFNSEDDVFLNNNDPACFSREDYYCFRDEDELHFNADNVTTSDSEDDSETSSFSENLDQGALCARREDPALPIPKGEFQRSLLEIAKRDEKNGGSDTRFLLVKRDYPEPRSFTPISKTCVGVADFGRNCPLSPEYSIVVRYEEFSEDDGPSAGYQDLMSALTWIFIIMTSIPFMLTVILLYAWY